MHLPFRQRWNDGVATGIKDTDVRILIVEDDPILALLAAEFVRAEGHEAVGPAHTAVEAMQLATFNQLDVALVDINLSGHDEGIELARLLKARYGILCVFLSGQVVVARESRTAAVGLLRKPYRLEDLGTMIRFVQALHGGERPLPAPPPRFEVFH